MRPKLPTLDLIQSAAILGVSPSANDQELRAAYLQKVQLHPPDRDPEIFEKIRDAYEQLKNPMTRAKAVLLGPDPDAPLKSLVEGFKTERRYVGNKLWVELLKEKRS